MAKIIPLEQNGKQIVLRKVLGSSFFINKFSYCLICLVALQLFYMSSKLLKITIKKTKKDKS